MCNYRDILQNDLLFQSQPFSNREAFLWIISNTQSEGFPVTVSILANKWKWHGSKVKRFLTRLQDKKLVIKETKSGKLNLKLANQNQTADRLVQTIIDSALQDNSGLESIQYRTEMADNYNARADNRPVQRLSSSDVEEDTEPKSNQEFTQKEEKKKRTKKRKEEETYIKEKNIPYGDTKKENLAENLDLQVCENREHIFKKNQIPIHLVSVSDIAAWARETLPFELDLSWELGKFQDYWNTTQKKPPKNGVAAFRNWLRKAVEIETKNKGERYDRFNNNRCKEKTSDFQRFLDGGARALAELERDRLDRKNTWQMPDN